MYYVYVIRNAKGELYKGQTSNIEKRLKEHNSGMTQSIRSKGPWNLVHVEEYKSREEALDREKFLKTASGRRELKIILLTR